MILFSIHKKFIISEWFIKFQHKNKQHKNEIYSFLVLIVSYFIKNLKSIFTRKNIHNLENNNYIL